MYGQLGFVRLAGGLSGQARGYNAEDGGEVMMIRPAVASSTSSAAAAAAVSLPRAPLNPGQAVIASYFREDNTPRPYLCEPLSLAHCPAATLLLNAFKVDDGGPQSGGKLPVIGIQSGLEAEEALIRCLQAAIAGELEAWAVVTVPCRRVDAVVCVKGGQRTIYSHPGREHECLHAHDAALVV